MGCDLRGCLGSKDTHVLPSNFREELTGFLDVNGRDPDTFDGCFEVFL